MGGFVKKISVAIFIVLICHLGAAFFTDGHTDPFYLRFTGKPVYSMIIGSSRAAQGLDPDVFNDSDLHGSYEGDLFNFSFTRAHSPYGPAYLEAIIKKLEGSTSRGLFIISVDPWVLANPIGSTTFPEDELAIGNMWTMNGTPNVEYLMRNYGKGWGTLIGGPLATKDSTQFLHRNGRLEIRIPMDSISMRKRLHKKILEYEDLANDMTYSEVRMEFLDRTIKYLKAHGRVLLVRIPMHPAIREVEDQFSPEFSKTMMSLAERHQVPFVDDLLVPPGIQFTDGNHIAAGSVSFYSKWLLRTITEGIAKDGA